MGGIGRIFVAVTAALVALAPAGAAAQTPTPSPSPSASPSPSPSPSPAASPTSSPSPSPSPSPNPSPSPSSPAAGRLEVSIDPGPTLTQVGAAFTYRLTISNTGSAPLTGVEIHQLVPAELDVTGVPVLDEVDYTQLGRIGKDEDILWGIDSMSAGSTITLSWFAKVAKAGDLIATGSITAEADGDGEEIEPPSIYLGDAEILGVVVPGEQSIARTVTQRRSVTGVGSLGAPGAVLPATGVPAEAGFAFLGLVLIAAGLFLRRERSRRTILHVSAAVALLLTGCVSDSGDPVEPEVKGTRIENEEPTETDEDAGSDEQPSDADDTEDPGEDDASDDGATDDDATDDGVPDLSTGAPDTGSAPVGFVEEEVVVQVPFEELDANVLAATPSDNQIAVDWSSSGGVLSAQSSLLFTPDAIATLRTTLSSSGDRVVANVTLENLSSDHRLVVKGRYLHEVAGLPGGRVTLRSPAVDTVLAPGAVTKQVFTYKLPTGQYTLDSRFVPSS